MSLYDALYDFFQRLIFKDSGTADELWSMTFGMAQYTDSNGIGHVMEISLGNWLCHTASIISIIIILVLCCLFVYKIIKLIGGLIR